MTDSKLLVRPACHLRGCLSTRIIKTRTHEPQTIPVQHAPLDVKEQVVVMDSKLHLRWAAI